MKVKLELRKRDVFGKIQMGREIIRNLSSNPHFSEPLPELEDLETTTDKLEEYWKDYNKVIRLPQIKLQKLNKSETEFDQLITALAFEVEKKSKGDVSLIQSAGFCTRAPRKSKGIPNQVEDLKVTDAGLSGCVNLKWKSITGAKCYNVEISTDAGSESDWVVIDTTTKAKAFIKDLNSDVKYRFRVTAVGTAGKGMPSESVVKYTQ